MRSTRLFWKLFLAYAGLNLVLAPAFLILASGWQKAKVVEQAEQRLRATAIILRSRVEQPLAEGSTLELQAILVRLSRETRMRMTLVGEDGRVVADSHENPERMQTLGIPMLYVALPVEHGGRTIAFVRVAEPLHTIHEQAAAVRRSLWLAAVALGVFALGLAYLTVVRLVRPLTELTTAAEAIAAGNHNIPIHVGSRDEVGMLATALNHMQTELARRIDELQDNNAQLVTVLSSMDEGVLAVDERGRLLLANDAGRKLLDFVTQDVVGRPLLEVTRSRLIHETVAAALNAGRAAHKEFEAPSTRRILSVRATCLPGQPCPGVVLVLHDVSDLRRLENLRREFVANVSHELKTPLASIKAYAETLRLGAVNDAQHNLAFVGRIEEQAERLHQLILDLLQIARIESGQQVFEISELSVSDAITSSVQCYADLATAKGISLTVVPPAESLVVKADEEGLRTMLDNLVDNAIKYTPAGGKVTIHWAVENSTVVIQVKDTGIGIAPRDQARVFERFYRVDKARSRELGGTGLGLSIVKHLAQSFGGSVGIDSQLGRGSTFQLRLPRA